jgi:hypothetical protein
MTDGGDVQLVDVKEGLVTVRLLVPVVTVPLQP